MLPEPYLFITLSISMYIINVSPKTVNILHVKIPAIKPHQSMMLSHVLYKWMIFRFA